MTDEEIIQGILEGCSLRTFMVPDPAMPSNYPEHKESYDLPHVIINGAHFWGKAYHGHLVYIPGDAPYGLNAFCYTNAADIFCSIHPDNGQVAMMRKARYKTHEWKLVRNYKLVWDSSGSQPAEAVASEIDACAKFRIALLDSEEIWNVHPVDLPMYEIELGRFQLKTVRDGYPMFFRHKTPPREWITQCQEIEWEDRIVFQTHIFECFYSVFSDGTYYNFYDIHRNTKQEYERLLVFSDNL